MAIVLAGAAAAAAAVVAGCVSGQAAPRGEGDGAGKVPVALTSMAGPTKFVTSSEGADLGRPRPDAALSLAPDTLP